LDRIIYEIKFPTYVSLFFSHLHSISLMNVGSSSTLRKFLSFVTSNIITSAVSCQLKRYLPEGTDIWPYQGRENGGIFKIHYYWKIILEPMTGNIVISEVGAFMYVVLSQAKSICFIGNHLVSSEILLFVYHKKNPAFEWIAG